MDRLLKLMALGLVLAGCNAVPQDGSEARQVVSTQNIPAAMIGVHAKQLFGGAPDGSLQGAGAFRGSAGGCLGGGVHLPAAAAT